METNRYLFLKMISLLAIALLAGCAGLGTMRQSTQDFYDAASALSTAEQRVLSDLNASIAKSYQDRAEADYLSGKNFDVAAKPPMIPQASIDVRIKAVRAVQLYAQDLLDLTSNKENKNVDAYTEAAARSLGNLLPNSVPAPDMGPVTAALTGLANIALDQERYKSIVDAAKAAQPNLETLAKLIKNDDTFIEGPMKTAAMVDGAARNQILEHIRSDKLVAKDRLHIAFRDVLSSGGVADLSAEQIDVDRLADAIVRANAILAKGEVTTSMAIVHDAVSRVNDAYQVAQAAKK